MKTFELTCIAIDDDPLFLRKMEAYVMDIEWLTMEKLFTDPLEAAGYIVEHSPDVVFLDIEMPQMDGYQVVDWIIPKLKHLKKLPKIVIVTANYELINFSHKAVAVACYKPDLKSPQDLESSIMKLIR